MKLTIENDIKRIDSFLSGALPSYSRGYFQKLIKAGKVTINGSLVNAHQSAKTGDEVEFELETVIKQVLAQNLPLEIIYEDKDIMVINKAPGMVVHPACGHRDGTVLNALYAHAGGKFNPFLVHRLDKDTSGILVIAKNEKAKKSMVKQFEKRAIKKVYITAVKGCVSENRGRIEAPLGRSPSDRKKIVVGPLAKKNSVTEFKVLFRSPEYSVLEVYPLTGRTHQIRSHMVYIGHPVLGDVFYGGLQQLREKQYGRQMLHARRITFTHPTEAKKVEFEAPLPEDMKGLYDEKQKK
jgi:23S rRNA pseudouridine1911/1915/1917 synthase